MYDFDVTDEHGDKHTYMASDMRMALVVHHQLYGTEAVSVNRTDFVGGGRKKERKGKSK